MSSLTADISDTNFLLDDVLHQLSLHADYSLLKSIKHQYTDIHNTRLSQQAAIKTSISQLSRGINELEDGIRGVGIAEVKAWKEGVKGSVQEKEEEVAELKTEEGRLSAEVKAKEEEGQRLEQKRKDRVKRHGERMHSHKKCLRLYSILSAVRFDVVDATQIRGTFHGLDSVQRSFAYSIDEESEEEGSTAFDATNRLWDELWNPATDEPFKLQLNSITAAIERLTFSH